MVSRLMLSVRKAAAADEGWESYTRPYMFTNFGDDPHDTGVRFAVPPTEIETIDLELDYLPHRPR